MLINLSQDADVDLPVKPLLFALAIGACFGGKKYNLANINEYTFPVKLGTLVHFISKC